MDFMCNCILFPVVVCCGTTIQNTEVLKMLMVGTLLHLYYVTYHKSLI
jgi:hypothetical protein